jgi:hypothetical protein
VFYKGTGILLALIYGSIGRQNPHYSTMQPLWLRTLL